jgi:hypothetical protein
MPSPPSNTETSPQQGPGLTREDGERLREIAEDLVTCCNHADSGIAAGIFAKHAETCEHLSQRALASPQEAGEGQVEQDPYVNWDEPITLTVRRGDLAAASQRIMYANNTSEEAERAKDTFDLALAPSYIARFDELVAELEDRMQTAFEVERKATIERALKLELTRAELEEQPAASTQPTSAPPVGDDNA